MEELYKTIQENFGFDQQEEEWMNNFIKEAVQEKINELLSLD